MDNESSKWPELWQAAYRILEQTVLPNQLKVWIQPLEFLDASQGDHGMTIQLQAANDFSAQWVKDRCLPQLIAAFTQVTGQNCEVLVGAKQISQSERQANELASSGEVLRADSPPVTGVVLHAEPKTRSHSAHDPQIDPRLTFDAFVVGASNQFAHASAIAVAERPARQYNPLFLYSAPGLGKTHLLHAIGNHVFKHNPDARIAYISAERFMNELIDSIQHNRMPAFRGKYRDSFDVILIDDIQFIAGKQKTEEEFFHTFNALHSSKRQIVMTSDRPPKEIEGLEERLRTRFEWGLIADITPPEIETRIAILKSKAERDDIYLQDEVATFLATYVKSNVRELEGILIRLQAHASLSGAEISLEMAKHELRTAVPEEGSQFTVESIQNAVAKHFRLKISDLKSSTRARSVSLPRQIAAFLIRKYTSMGFKEIGGYFGGKDHTTILHACRKIEKDMETDPNLRDQVETIQNLL